MVNPRWVSRKYFTEWAGYTQMNIILNGRLFLSSSKDSACKKLFEKFKKHINEHAELDVFFKEDQYEFSIKMDVSSWAEGVYEVICFCQPIGYKWLLTGTAAHEVSLWSNNSKISGIESVEVSCEKHQ